MRLARVIAATALGAAVLQPSFGLAAEPPSAVAVSSLALLGDAEELLPAATLNGAALPSGTIYLRAGGRIFAPQNDIAAWNLDLTGASVRQFRGARYVELDSLAGITVAYDDSRQTLAVGAPATAFRAASPHIIAPRLLIGGARGSGQYVDYEIAANGGSGSTSIVSHVLFGAFNPAGTLTSDYVVSSQAGDGQHAFQRLGTAWTRDMPARHAMLRFGDGIVGGGALADDTRFAGITYATTFVTDPGFIAFPTPALRGSAVVPSIVDVYVNGVATQRQRVDPGSFSIDRAPVVNGDGTIELQYVDELGRRRSVTQHFYGATQLLKPGLSDFSYSAGLARIDYGTATDRYGPAEVSLTDRRGMRDNITAEAHLEANGAGRLASLEADTLVGRLGVFRLGTAFSAAAGGHGTAALFGYDYQRRGLSVGAEMIARTAAYRPTADALGSFVGTPNTGSSMTAHLSYAARGGDSASVSYVSEARAFVARQALGTVAFTHRLREGTITFTALSARSAGANSTRMDLTLVRPIGPRARLTAGTRAVGGGVEPVLGFDARSGRGDQARSYGALADTSAGAANVSVYGRQATRYGDIDASVYDFAGSATANVTYTGSILRMGSAIALSRQLGESFALVNTGAPHVRVSANREPLGTSDRNGNLVLPYLAPYQDNVIAIDPNDVPFSLDVSGGQHVVPARNAGVKLSFGKAVAGAVSLTLVDDRGHAVPAASGVRVFGQRGGTSWPVGDDGLAYLSPVSPGALRLVVEYPDGRTCTASIVVPGALAVAPDLGAITCEASQIAGHAPESSTRGVQK